MAFTPKVKIQWGRRQTGNGGSSLKIINMLLLSP
jgi:hypothetical protein